MVISRLRYSAAFVCCVCLVTPASAATLSATTTTLTQGVQGDGIVQISVFPGAAAYDGVTLNSTTTMGDGTVEDYAFYNDDNVTNEDTDTLIAPYAAGTASLIGDFNVTNGPGSGTTRIRDDGGVSFFDVWNTTDPAGFTSNADFFGGSGGNDTAARVATANGDIDVSGFVSGAVYVFYGTFQNDNAVTATLRGPGQVDIDATGGLVTGEGLSGDDRAINSITAFSFTTDGIYDTLNIAYEHADQDSSPGSRARFAAVVVDGVVVPEPSAATPLAVVSMLGFIGRRKPTISV